jgi:uncharacterized membrane protein YsdA (DUF1294 family)
MVRADLLIGVALLYLAAISGVTWLAFATDKAAAPQGHSRVAESTLLLLALMGGTPAAYGARHSLRHKTRKQPFSAQLHTIAALQAGALIALSAKVLGLY